MGSILNFRYRSSVLRHRFLLIVLFLQAVGTLVYFQFLTSRDKLNESGSDEGQQHASRVHDRHWVGVLRAVAYDRGGWNSLEPVLELALADSVHVQVLLGGASAQHHRQGLLVLDNRVKVTLIGEIWDEQAAQAAVRDFVNTEHAGTMVAASASTEGTAAGLEALCSSRAPGMVVVEDTYGTAGALLAQVTSMCPDRAKRVIATVGDKIGQQLIHRRVPQFPGSVRLTGAPQYDAVARMRLDFGRRRHDLRQHLGVSQDEVLVLMAGQPRGTHEMLHMLRDAVFAASNVKTKLLLRQHPRATSFEQRSAQTFREQTHPDFFVDADLDVYPSSVDLLPAADVVMSGFSTTNYFAILLGIRDVVFAGTPALLRDLQLEKGLTRPPETDAGAGWFVDTSKGLSSVLNQVHAAHESKDAAKVRAAQKDLTADYDGQAAKRVWDVTMEHFAELHLFPKTERNAVLLRRNNY